jgi:pantoate--beta-alanine ligase
MELITDPSKMQVQALARRARGERIGLVPTMGYLHSGHTSLMEIARKRCDWLVASIYVNPLQFGPNEDLDRYPRDPGGDAAKCAAAGVDALFMPEDLYGDGHATSVTVRGLTDNLCGESRPGHLDGVTTVVSRLFGLVQPSVAVFGEKDFQQLAVIQRMTRDLALPIEVIGGPLVRDTDGIALSSRNRYLTPEKRQQGLTLHRALFAMRKIVQDADGAPVPVTELLACARQILDVDSLHYLDVRTPDSLESVDIVTGPARAFVAAIVGQTRLIDNVALR